MATANEAFTLNVLIRGKSQMVTVYRHWRVWDLKELLALRQDVEPNCLRVIFAGAEIRDNFSFKNCDISQGSVLHVIAEEVPSVSKDKEKLITVPSLGPTDERLEVQPNGRHRARFFVYCKSVCCKVCLGKLRVRCRTCKSQGIRIDKEPDCWDDVLVHSRITGTCMKDECPGNISEFFFKCREHSPCEDERDEAFPLSMVRTNVVNAPCLICAEVPEIVFVFSCLDTHTICLECFGEYCRSLISSRQFVMVSSCDALAYTVVCPGNGENCNSSFVTEPHHFRIPGKAFYNRYQAYAAEDMVLQSGGVLCPGVDCGNGLFPGGILNKVLCDKQLGGCGLEFCRNCLQKYHKGPCVVSDESNMTAPVKVINVSDAERAQWDRSSRALIKQIAKLCPRCKMPIEKNGGCNHMTCTHCRFSFCWLCLVEWSTSCQYEHWFLG